MIIGDLIETNETDDSYILDSNEIDSLENDYRNQHNKHFLVCGLCGTGKTNLINSFFKEDLLIAFSHGEDKDNRERKTIFQCLFEAINLRFNNIEIVPLSDSKISIYRILDFDAIPNIIKATFFEYLPFFGFGYFLKDHYELILKTLEIFKDPSFKSWIKKNIDVPESYSETQIQEEIDSVWHNLNKLKIVDVLTLSDPPLFYKVFNYQFLTKEEKDILFKGVPISIESCILRRYEEILRNNLKKLKYKPLMNLIGIRNNLDQKIDERSFDDWYESNKRSINIELFKKRFVTPYILFNMYLKDNLKLDLNHKTLFVDDYQLFANDEVEVLSKMMKSANRTFIVYDPLVKIFDFRNENKENLNVSRSIEDYLKNYSPKVYKLTENTRVEEDWLINKANEAIEQIKPRTKWRYSNSVTSSAQGVQSPLIEMLKERKNGRIGIVFRTNEQIDKFCEILIENKLSFTRITNNFLETFEGTMYVNFLFKYLLSIKPTKKFENSIRRNKTFNINWPIFEKIKTTFLTFNLEKPDSIFNVFNDNNKFKYIAYFLLIETKGETLRDAMNIYLDEPYKYIYYHSHYYNQVYEHKPLINVLNFHKLKQISYFDRVLFPLTLDDSKGYNYLAIAKAKLGYGLFPFQVIEGGNYKEINEEIIADFIKKTSMITLFNKME